MKHELLSPVGDMESLYQAIHNGADAVYLGIKNFGARAFAKNFTDEELIKAVKMCHLYGLRIYVTMNTLIKDNEVDLFLERVRFLKNANVDALIMQDFGMICLVREMFPNLEIHASTQFNNSSINTIKFLKNIGVKRVVLSRELSLSEIKKIDVDIELEVFIHGALCISYSGNCLMSSMIGKRSGNRGECAGSCRLKYSLYDNDNIILKNKYLLSTKELNTSTRFNELLDSNIYSFKIEGRMKSPLYVGFITRFYRKLIDREEFNLKEETDKLKTLFNRKFTEGNLFCTSDLMNIDTPNHIGIEIGKVISINKKYIEIKLNRELNQNDGIRFMESRKGLIINYLYDKNKKLINSSDNIVFIDNKIDLKTKDTVYKTLDSKLNKELEEYSLRKIPVTMYLKAKIGEKLYLEINCFDDKISIEGNNVNEALTSPISKERIQEQLQKLGNTPFRIKNITIDLDENVFISIKELNELRRTIITKLTELRENKSKTIEEKKPSFSKINYNKENGITCSCYRKNQIITCLKLNFLRIYVRNKELYNKYKNYSNIYYYNERNNFNIDSNLEDKNLVSEYFLPTKNTYGDYFLNVYNIYTAYYLLKYGFKNICLSVELNEEEILSLLKKFKTKFGFLLTPEVVVYGRTTNMMIKQNIFNITNDLFRYKILGLKKEFPVYVENNNTYILNYQNKNIKIDDKNIIKRFDFYDEDSKMITDIVNKLK